MNFLRTLGSIVLVQLISPALPVLAQVTNPGPAGGGDPTGTGDTILSKGLRGLQDIACRIFQWVYTFAIIIGVIFIVLAAIQYMTAKGDTEKVRKAHASLMNAVIGIAVALVAWGVPNIIASFLKSKERFGDACP